MYLARLYWAKRLSDRKYRAAKGRFGPKRRFRARALAKRYTRRGPPQHLGGGKGEKGITGHPRKGFFIGEHFVSLDHIPENDIAAFFQGKYQSPKRGNGGKDMRCFNCGETGHMAKQCRKPQKCFKCGGEGHVSSECTKGDGRNKAMVMWGTPESHQHHHRSQFTSALASTSHNYLTLGRLHTDAEEFIGMIMETGGNDEQQHRQQQHQHQPHTATNSSSTDVNDVEQQHGIKPTSTMSAGRSHQPSVEEDPWITSDPWGGTGTRKVRKTRETVPEETLVSLASEVKESVATSSLLSRNDPFGIPQGTLVSPVTEVKDARPSDSLQMWNINPESAAHHHHQIPHIPIHRLDSDTEQQPEAQQQMRVRFWHLNEGVIEGYGQDGTSFLIRDDSGMVYIVQQHLIDHDDGQLVSGATTTTSGGGDLRSRSANLLYPPRSTEAPGKGIEPGVMINMLRSVSTSSSSHLVELGVSTKPIGHRHHQHKPTMARTSTGSSSNLDSLSEEAEKKRQTQNRHIFGCEIQSSTPSSVLPVFEWEEEDILLANPNAAASKFEMTETNEKRKPQHQSSYSHSATRIEGVEGLLVDSGAVSNLTGGDFVTRAANLAKQHGRSVKWFKLPKPKCVSGVGDQAKSCEYQACVPGMLENGQEIRYIAPVIGGDPSPVPPLYSLECMADTNTYMGMRSGLLAMVPDGAEREIRWPQGTTFIQCKKAPSGHWLVVCSAWESHQGPH